MGFGVLQRGPKGCPSECKGSEMLLYAPNRSFLTPGGGPAPSGGSGPGFRVLLFYSESRPALGKPWPVKRPCGCLSATKQNHSPEGCMETPLGCSSAADARQQGGWIRPKTGLGIWGLGFGVWGFSVTRERSALRTQHHPASRLWGGGACQADCSCVKCDRPAEMRWRCEGPTMQRTQGPLAKPTQTNALWGLALRWAPNSQAMVPAIPHCGAYAVPS